MDPWILTVRISQPWNFKKSPTWQCWESTCQRLRIKFGPTNGSIWPNGIIFHQPRFPWNFRGFPLLNHHLGWKLVFSVAIIWPDRYVWSVFFLTPQWNSFLLPLIIQSTKRYHHVYMLYYILIYNNGLQEGLTFWEWKAMVAKCKLLIVCWIVVVWQILTVKWVNNEIFVYICYRGDKKLNSWIIYLRSLQQTTHTHLSNARQTDCLGYSADYNKPL